MTTGNAHAAFFFVLLTDCFDSILDYPSPHSRAVRAGSGQCAAPDAWFSAWFNACSFILTLSGFISVAR